MIGIIEARFYMKDDKSPMTYIKYCENGIEKTLHAPSVRFKENLNIEVSDFVKKIVNQHNNEQEDEITESFYNGNDDLIEEVIRPEISD